MSSSNPYSQSSNFVDLLNSQQDSFPFFSNQCTEDANFGDNMTDVSRERRKWSPIDDVVLISSWLNTSNDAVVSNEQKSGAFWKRIADYFAASPKVAGPVYPEPGHCKQRWQKINDLVCKFCGCYEAAAREKASGQNENDILKLAYSYFYSDYGKKFTLEHAWKELRNDQKWCELSTSKTDGGSKRRKCEDGTQSSNTVEDDQVTNRPPGVKAAKGKGKRTMVEGKVVAEFQSTWSIKEKDMAMKERMKKMDLIDSLIAKQEPLSEYEEALKKKLITDMLSN
ncbi:Glutathione S-transferase T3 [Cardamine amara subsp. amara]|uniref:Glutathione S-transferase T3 n=1 Tax=Cardamine amara subsp. amara TaxID=228776 RepID=A0ABD1C7I0_CARAN